MEVTFLTNEDESRIVAAAKAESVLVTAQSLSETQKARARENIGAVSLADISGNANKTCEKIATITVTAAADGTLPKHAVISLDDDGKPFELTDFMIKACAGFVDGNKSALYMDVNNTSIISNGVIGSISSACRYFNIFYRKEANGFCRAEYTSSAASNTYFNPQTATDVSRVIPPMMPIATQNITRIDLYTELGDTKAWVEGSTFELWGIRA